MIKINRVVPIFSSPISYRVRQKQTFSALFLLYNLTRKTLLQEQPPLQESWVQGESREGFLAVDNVLQDSRYRIILLQE